MCMNKKKISPSSLSPISLSSPSLPPPPPPRMNTKKILKYATNLKLLFTNVHK